MYWRTEQLINSIEGNCLIDQCIVKLNLLQNWKKLYFFFFTISTSWPPLLPWMYSCGTFPQSTLIQTMFFMVSSTHFIAKSKSVPQPLWTQPLGTIYEAFLPATVSSLSLNKLLWLHYQLFLFSLLGTIVAAFFLLPFFPFLLSILCTAAQMSL